MRRVHHRHVTQAMTLMQVYTLSDLNGAMLADYRAQVTASTLAPGSQAQALAAVRLEERGIVPHDLGCTMAHLVTVIAAGVKARYIKSVGAGGVALTDNRRYAPAWQGTR